MAPALTRPSDPNRRLTGHGPRMPQNDPMFSLVTAVYGVKEFLPAFIASVEAQSFDLGRVEVIAVDDGSTDGSAEVLAEWAARRPELVRVVRQDNAGQGAARNTGLAEARGQWVGFPDPDDVLDKAYLASVARFLETHPETDLVAANRWLWVQTDDDPGRPTDSHPLRYMYVGDRLVDLVADEQHFQGSAPASFFRLSRIRETGLEFDVRVRPIFEDGHFTTRYLLDLDRPMAGFLGSAKYHYRRRETSTLGASRGDERRYADALEHGYLDIVQRAVERHGKVPRWLESHLVFDLSWYFTRDDSRSPVGTPLGGPVAERYHELIAQVLSHLDLEVAAPYSLAPIGIVPRLILQHGYTGRAWHEPFAVLEKLDEQQNLVRATYFYTGDAPAEELLLDGGTGVAQHAKTRDLVYSGRVLLRQRIVWLPANQEIEIHLDGHRLDLVTERPAFPRDRSLPRRTRAMLNMRSPRNRLRATKTVDPMRSDGATTRKGRLAVQAMRSGRLVERYKDAWVFMDRIHDAGDSGEILFHHVRRHHPDVNAFFVVEKDTATWKRMSRMGLGHRLVAHDSVRWRVLMCQALHLLSSHCDVPVMQPPAIRELVNPRWRFTFLEHGVIKDDLSGWLNGKDFDLFVTSTPAEHAFLAGDHSTFRLTTREAVMTGLPRFDRLHEKGAAFPPDARDLLLVAPTWRKELGTALVPGTQRRDMSAVLGSDFLARWLGLIGSARVRAACAEHGLRLGLLPHPNLAPVLPQVDLPDHVELLDYEQDPQDHFARARLVVTDFSSIAFNAAYLERPLVYYQFDEDVVLGGGHTGRQGYFDYRRDGFGPVTLELTDAEDAVLAALAHGATPAAPYDERVRATFPMRDGQCCERVVAAVRASTTSRGGTGPVPTPVAP